MQSLKTNHHYHELRKKVVEPFFSSPELPSCQSRNKRKASARNKTKANSKPKVAIHKAQYQAITQINEVQMKL